MNIPSFSVVTICRNDLSGLRRTVESLQRQSCRDWQQIIVDGGSTDGTVEFLRSLDDERIEWSSESDSGIYDAMNKGVTRCRANLVLIINSGDALASSDSLATYLRDHGERGWNWCYGAIRLTDEAGCLVGAYSFDPFKRWRFIMGLDWIPFASVCFTRQLLSETGPFRTDLGTAADQELLMRALKLEEPSVITWFTADYAMGGVSQDMGSRERELAWHMMRRENKLHWRSNSLADRAISEVLAMRRPLRILGRRLGGST